MKKLGLLLILVGITGLAQVKGNKNIVTKTMQLDGLTHLEMGLYANVTIDQNARAQMTITADSNLQALIDTEVVDGKLKLSQLEWIQPSQRIKIIIGAPLLKFLEIGVNETVRLQNVNRDTLSLMALNGKIIVSGSANSVSLDAENGIIDASKLNVKEAVINIWGKGKAIVNATDLVKSKLDKAARLVFVQQPKEVKGDTNQVSKKEKQLFANAQYINIKIKNNSFKRNHFRVEGPKEDGSYFGYGFSMIPGASKKERWTIGTKIYSIDKSDNKTLLITVRAVDADETIKLFH